MAESVVIVALPPVDDRVTKISSEDKAHLTMLFLGEVDLSDEAILYVQHACRELSPFGLTVDYRGTLGEDDADVLFFEKNSWDLERVAEFRHHLLLNDEIKRAYDTAPQYPEWTPHLTLGYPERPAKELDEDGRFHYVSFDRIAVWTGESDGPEFRLKYDDTAMEVAMSDLSLVERGALAASTILGHDPDAAKQYGVKGMKWGVRNDKGHEGEAVKTKKLGKLDKKWEKENTGVRGWVKVNNAVADRMNNGLIDKHNNDPRWADVDDFTDTRNPKVQEYFREYEKLANKVWAEETVKLGSNPSGTKAYELREDENGEPYGYLAPVKKDVKHAEGDVESVLRINKDSNGRITDVEMTELELKHYGVKGMKWGVRKTDSAAKTAAAQEVTVTQKKPGTFAKTSGGKKLPISEDAEEALRLRQKARGSTTDALSNKELQTAITRMNLEQQYSNLSFQSDRRSRGARFVAGLLGDKRYGKKRVFTDNDEEMGEKVRKAVESHLASKNQS